MLEGYGEEKYLSKILPYGFFDAEILENCATCGAELDAERGYYERDGFPYCRECIEYAEIETLIRICETNKREWLEKLGFYFKRI